MCLPQRIEYKDTRDVTREALIVGSYFMTGQQFVLVMPRPKWVGDAEAVGRADCGRPAGPEAERGWTRALTVVHPSVRTLAPIWSL